MRDALVAVGVEVAPAEPRDHDAIGSVGEVAAIGIDQLGPGLVVLDLDPTVLLEDKRVTYTGRPARRSGPFVCLFADDGLTTWTGLTRSHRAERLAVLPKWRAGGNEAWQTRKQYVTDAANLWEGPADAFAAAAWRETFTAAEQLPRLTAEGLDVIRQRCRKQRWRQGKPTNAFGGAER